MKAFALIFLIVLLCFGFSNRMGAQTPLPTDATSARQLLAAARVSYDSGQYLCAAEYAGQAYHFFRQVPENYPDDFAESAYQLGRALYERDSFLQSKILFNESIAAWNKLHPEGSTREVNVRIALGYVWLPLQNADSMLEQGLKSLDILDRLPGENYPERMAASQLVGRLYFGMLQYKKAIPFYESALKYARASPVEDEAAISEILKRLGHSYTYCGMPDEALHALELALAIQQKKPSPSSGELAALYSGMGMCARALKKYDNAIAYFEKCIELRTKKGKKPTELLAVPYSGLGQIYLEVHDYAKAKAYFQKEDTVLTLNNGRSDIPYAYCCRDLGLANFGLKQYKEAIQRYDQALALFLGPDSTQNKPLGMDEANVIFLKGRAQSAEGNYEAAIRSQKENQAILRQNYKPDFPSLHESDAEIAYAYYQWFLKTGQDSLLEKSRSYFDLAERDIEQQLQNETNEDAQKKLLSEAVPVFERAIKTELTFNKTRPKAATNLEKVWQLSEAMHSYLLFSATQEDKARHFAGIPDAELERDSALRATLAVLRKQRESLLEDKVSLTDSLMVALNLQISAKKEDQKALRAYFEKKFPDYFRLKYDLQTSALEKTQQLLSPEQTLLEYFTGDSSIFVFVVQHESSRMVELKRDFPLADWVKNLQTGISGYHTALQKPPGLYQKTVTQYADFAQKLYEKLLAPIAGFLRPELIIVPGDGFANLPFEALLPAAPKDLSSFNTYPFLLRSHTVQYAYSATMLHQMSAFQHLQTPPKGLLAFAPFFEEDTASLALRLHQEAAVRQGFSPLPYSGEEVFRAEERYPGSSDVLIGKLGTKAQFLEMAARYKIIHLATHGKANHLAGDFSFLAFASSDEHAENGLLSVGELYNLPINADLVLLSACETGLGEQQRGEGVVSLARAFAYAGAKSIVASLWSVNDKSTMEVMDNFYAGMKEGKPKNIALASAKRRYLEENPGVMAHPFFWAGFIGVGDMRPINP